MKTNDQLDEQSQELLKKWTSNKPIKVLQDENDYDQSGNKVTYEESETDTDLLDPYDPGYMETPEDGNPCRITKYEQRFLRKVSILQNKLVKSGINFDWYEQWSCFRVWKLHPSGYPIYRYLRINMEENDYSFGTASEDLVFDGKVSVSVDEAVAWVNSKLINK